MFFTSADSKVRWLRFSEDAVRAIIDIKMTTRLRRRPSQPACAKARHHHKSRRRWRMSHRDIIFNETNDVTHANASRLNASWSVGRQPSTQWNGHPLRATTTNDGDIVIMDAVSPERLSSALIVRKKED